LTLLGSGQYFSDLVVLLLLGRGRRQSDRQYLIDGVDEVQVHALELFRTKGSTVYVDWALALLEDFAARR